jgi:adenylylsulfate kinase
MSWAIWLTGLPGSGKSTLARAAGAALAEQGCRVTVLELDAMRRVVTPAPTYSDAERDLVYHALVWLAATLVDSGVPVIVDATAHRREWRDLARVVIPAFAEVQLTCGPEACRQRASRRADGGVSPDPYAQAGASRARVPGVDVEYEPAAMPELTIDTETTRVADAAAYVCKLARSLPAPATRAPGNGWAVWITGLPGSGKTTLTSRVAKALGGYGVAVRVLELGDLLVFIAGSGVSPLAELIAHRTLVYAAKVLSEAGLPVIVDATAPARAWRELARELIARFAEVQLLCPPEVCATRERAVRWRLIGCPYTAPLRHSNAPDIALAYEPSLRPDLVIHTDVEDPWSATAAVLRLARRLHVVPPEPSWTRAIAG